MVRLVKVLSSSTDVRPSVLLAPSDTANDANAMLKDFPTFSFEFELEPTLYI